MSHKLPDGWAETQLGNLIELKYGKALPQPERTGSGYSVYGSNGVVGAHAHALTKGPTLVIGRKGSVGEINFSASACSPIDTTYFVDDVPGGQFRFWFHLLQSLGLNELNKSTAIPGLSRSDVYLIDVCVPPLPEQQRIADKLDTVLARVDACRDRLARVAPLLKRFRQSVLAAATSGRLTEDLEPEFEARLESLSSLGAVSGGLTKNAKRDELAMRRPYLRVANVHANELRLHDVTEIGLTEAEFAKTRLVAGDLLIVEGNGSIEQIGRVAMWSGEIANCCHQNHLIRWRAGARVLPKFVLSFLLSPEGRRQIEAVASSTTGLHTLSVSKVGELQLPVPSLALQSEIVRRVETLFAFADRLEARLAQAQTAVDRLTPSLLAKAFRGELVSQDPADEPASELLQRLREATADNAAPARSGRRRAPPRTAAAQDTP